jgi:hypothetical protein
MAFRDGGPPSQLRIPMICTAVLMLLTCTTLFHVNPFSISESELTIRNSEPRRSKTDKLAQPSTWYIPGNPKVNSMGFEWADAQRQSPSSVYTSSTSAAPADIIYQTPTYAYTENNPNGPAPDTMYQSTGTTQSYNSQSASYDYIPQYTRIWNSPDQSTGQSDFVPQMIGTVVNARGRAGRRAPARSSRRLSSRARTQALLSIPDEPSSARLDAIQKELDDLKDPAQRRRHRVHAAAGAPRFAAVGGPLAATVDRHRRLRAWQQHTAGGPRAPAAPPRAPAPRARRPR